MTDADHDDDAGQEADTGRRHGAEHLERWRFRPGQSGNPGGRPRGRVNLTRRIEKRLLEAVEEGGPPFADLLARRIVSAAIADPVKATALIRAFQDRDEGPVEQRTELSVGLTMRDIVATVEAMGGDDLLDDLAGAGRG